MSLSLSLLSDRNTNEKMDDTRYRGRIAKSEQVAAGKATIQRVQVPPCQLLVSDT